jgi:antitoxin VapB
VLHGQDILAYTLVYGTIHSPAQRQDFHEQPQPSGPPAQGFSIFRQRSFYSQKGKEVILSPKSSDWSEYLAKRTVASPEFMQDIEDLPVQEREF